MSQDSSSAADDRGRQGTTLAAVGLGANLGDARATLLLARGQLAGLSGTRLRAWSALYRSAPIDAQGPDFINAVALLDTALAPHALLDELQRIEAGHGRERPYVNAPRTLDLDLLLYGDQCVDTPRLRVPHPRLHERAFVLLPLAEVWPDAVIAGRGPLAEWIRRASDQRIEKLPP